MSARTTTGYAVEWGRYKASSVGQQGDRLLLALLVELDMDGIGGRCVIELGEAGFAPVASGEAVIVKLDIGDGMMPVFTGEADGFAVTATGQRVAARDDLAKLAAFDQEGAFENQTADAIIKTLIKSAGARPGIIAKGPGLPFYVVHRGSRTLRHVQRLAELCGADLYTDAEGKVQCAVPKNGSPDHTFRYGANVLRLDLQDAAVASDSVEIFGEGAASAKGAGKEHWLPTKLEGVASKAALKADGSLVVGRLGKRPVRLMNGALRSGEAVKQAAEARMKNLASRRVRGFIEVFGAPKIKLGDLVSINDLPDEHGAGALLDPGPLRVRSVRHTLDRSRGLVTRIGF